MTAPRFSFSSLALTKAILAAVVGAFFLVLPVSVLVLLKRGLDVSDTGHYYVSLNHFSDITMMTTQFALVWNLLPLPDNIWTNRLVAFVLLTGSSAVLFLQAGWAVFGMEARTKITSWILVCAGGGSGALFYYYWLPDPSYNSIGLILISGILAATFALTRINDVHSWHFRGLALFAGFAALGLAATRLPSTLLLAMISAALFVMLAKPAWQRLMRLIIFILLGAALFFVLVQIFIEPLNVTLERIQGGLHKREILGVNRLVSIGFSRFWGEINTALTTAPWAVFMTALGGALAAPESTNRFVHARWLHLMGAVLGALGLAGLMMVLWKQSNGLQTLPLKILAYYMLNLGVAASLVAGFAGMLSNTPERKTWYWKLFGVCVLLVLTTLSFTLLGSGLWLQKTGIATVFIALACTLVALRLSKGSGAIWALAMAGALFMPMWAVRTHMINAPYRLETPLGAQTQPTSIRGGRSVILLDPVTKTFFDRLSAVADQMGPVGQRPILIDLSGRMPMVQYHLNARPAYTPWILSAYKGSDAFLATVIGRMSDDELARAWILDAPGYKYRLNPAPLIARGYDPGRDYRIATSAFAPYIKTNIVLLAPGMHQPSDAIAEPAQ